MKSDVHDTAAEALLRSTFTAAAETVTPTAPPDLATVPRIIEARSGKRTGALRWVAAAAAVAVAAGIGARFGTPDTRVKVGGRETPASSPLHPYLEPTSTPTGMVLVSATQTDRPPQYMADVIAADGQRATLHWTISHLWDVPAMRDPGFDAAPTHISGDDNNPDLRVWAEPTPPAQHRLGTTAPDEPRAPSPQFLTALAVDLARHCKRSCPTYQPSADDSTLNGAVVERQGPDTPNTGQTVLRYTTSDRHGALTVATYNTASTLPSPNGPMVPAPGLASVFKDDPELSTRSGRLRGGQPFTEWRGSNDSTLIVEFPDSVMSAVVSSPPVPSEPSDPQVSVGLTSDELVEVAESLVPRASGDFTELTTRLHDDTLGPRLASLPGDGWSVEFGDYVGKLSLDQPCLLLASIQLTGPRWETPGGGACPERDTDPASDPVAMTGVIGLDHGRRALLGIYDDRVTTVRLSFADGTTLEPPTTPIEQRNARVLAVELPATAMSVTLLDERGQPLTSASPTAFDNRLDSPLWTAPPGR